MRKTLALHRHNIPKFSPSLLLRRSQSSPTIEIPLSQKHNKAEYIFDLIRSKADSLAHKLAVESDGPDCMAENVVGFIDVDFVAD